MKSFWTAIVIAAFLTCGGILFNKNIDSVTEEMLEKEKKVSELIESENFEAAEGEIDALKGYIDKKVIILASAIDHKTVDEIELCTVELSGYTELENKAEAMQKCKKLEHLISHLPANYDITLQNIL